MRYILTRYVREEAGVNAELIPLYGKYYVGVTNFPNYVHLKVMKDFQQNKNYLFYMMNWRINFLLDLKFFLSIYIFLSLVLCFAFGFLS